MRKSFIALALTLALLLVSVGIKAQSTTTYLNEDFESTSTSTVPSGWDNTDVTQGTSSSTSSSYRWNVYSGGYNSSKCVRLYCYYYYVSSTRLKTPAMTLSSSKDAMVSFVLKNNSATVGDFSLYVTTDDGVTKTPIVQHVLTGTTWTEYNYSLAAYKGQTIKLLFEGAASTTSAYYYLDDVVVKDAPTCQSPDGVYINGLTQSSATVNWGINTTYGSAPDQFRVTLRDANDNVVAYNGAVAGTSTSYTFTGLSGNSTYTAWVRSDCDYQSYSGYSDSVSVQFTTLAPAQSVPYYQDFDNLTSLDAGGLYYSNATLNTTASYAYGSTGKSAKLTTTVADGAYIIFPLLNVAANNVEIDYYIRRQSSSTTNVSLQAGYLTDPSDISGTFVPVSIDSLPKDANWANKRFNTGSITDTTNPVMICIYIGSGLAMSAYVDNVSIHTIPTCTRPENLTITNYGANDVTLDWSMANANNVLVYIIDGTDTTTQVATQHPYTVTGLTPQTTYQFRVQGICSASDSSEVSTPVSVKTRCATASSPLFFEGAESTTGTALPDCWETGHIHKATSVTSDPFYTGTTYHHSGSRCLILRDMTSGNIAYLCSQKMDFGQTAGTYSFRYWFYRPSGTTSTYNGEGLKIFVTPTVGDTTNAVQVIPFVNRLASFSPTGSTGWNEYEGIINYTGQGYIMIVGYSKFGLSSYFDDMEVFTTPTCPKPSGLQAGNATQTTADLSWTAGNTETQWLVSYTLNQGSTTVATVTDSLVSGQPLLTISGLNSATTYTVANASVRAYCGVGDTSEVISISNVNFTTQCAALSAFPYTMGFEESETYIAYSSYRHPMCWTHYNSLTSTTSSYHYYPYSYSSSTYAHTGSRCLYYYAGKSSTSYADTAILSLPQIDTTVQPVNNLRIKFWTRNSSTSYSMPVYIGVMTNPNDPSTFVKVDSVTVTGSTHTESIVNLNNYVGTGTYIALGYFKAAMTSSYSYIYLDDVTLEAIPSCADLSGGLTVTAASDSTVTLTMTDLTATNWQYAYGLTGTDVTAMTPVNATGSTLTLTGLAEATTYDIYVRRDCGNGDYGAWANVTTFSTTAVPATMPYLCGFEDAQENARWQYTDGAGVNVFTIGTATSGVYAGSYGMYVTSSRTSGTHTYSTSSATKAYAYRTLHFDAKGYQVEMKAKCTGGESSWDFGRILLTNTSETLPSGTTGSSYSSTTFPNAVVEFDEDFVYSNYKMLNCSTTVGKTDANGWVSISYFLDMTNRPGDYNLVLMWNDDSSTGNTTYPLAVDSIHIWELTCIPPSAILTDSVSSTGFKLNLQHQTATQFEVIVDDESFTKESLPDSALYRQIVNNSSVWITGLTANTQYYYAVRTICGANDTSDWSDVTSVNTFCAAVNLPVSEGFESTTSTNCWQNISSTGSITRNTSYRHSGTASMKITEANAVSPELNVVTLAPDMLNGWCYSTTDSTTFAVGIMTDPNDASTFEPLTTVVIPARNTWTEFTSYFTLLTDPDYSDFYNARYIVLSVPAGETVYFDDFIIDQTPTCPKPTEVSITNITAHSFDISFTNNAPGCTSWQVTTNGTPHIINTNPATITGLNAASDYEVQIAAICSATDTSYYTLVGSIRTLCDKINLPWSTGFESSEGYTHTGSYYAGALEEQCWNTLNVKYGGATYPYYYVSTTSSYVHTGTQGLYTYTYSSATKDKMYLILPEFVEASNALKIKFWYKNYSTSTSYSQLKVGYMTDINVDSTFVTIEALNRYSAWTEAEVLTNTAGINVPANARIAFCIDRSGTYGYGLYLDDISVAQIRNCSDPNTPVVSNITSSSATVTFTDTCSTHNSWQYVYGIRGFNPNTATPTAVDSTRTFTLSGLTDDSNYEVYVRAICGVGDTSNYVKASFHTLCTPFHVTANTPFSESFTDFNYGAYITNESPCYTLPNQYTSSTSYMAKAYPSTDPSTSTSSYKYCYAHSADNTDKCLYWYMYSSYYPNGGTILRQFRLDADSVYELSAWVRTSTSTSYSTKFSALLGTSTTVLDTLTTKTVNGSSVSSQYIGGQYWYFYNTLYQQIKTVVSVDSTGDYYIGFNAAKGNTYSYVYMYLDDWTITSYGGCAPKVPTVDSITTNSAHVSMSDTAYQFEYVLNDTTATTTIVNTTEFDLTGLNPSTSYSLFVRSYCDATTYSDWVEVPFSTLCGAVTAFPYTENFDGQFLPNCWSQHSYGTYTNSWSTSSSYSHSGSKSAYIMDKSAGAKTALTTGELSLTNPNGYEVTLWVYRQASSYQSKVDEAHHIYVSSQPITTETQESAATEIGVVNAHYLNTPAETSSGWHEYTFTIPTSCTGSQYVSVVYHNQYGTGSYIDDLTVSEIPACRGPKSAPTVTGTTMTTLSAQAAMAGKDTIEFGIAPYSASVTTASITSTVLSTDGNCTFTGLTGSTGYAVWYRYHCDSNQVSDWSTSYARGTTTASDCFDPQNLHTIGIINDHHAEITWGAAPSVNSYVYELYQGSSTAGTLVDSAVTTLKPDTIVYDSLSANSAYFFRVRGFCSGDTTNWVTVSFSTTYPTLAMPFVCNFENTTINNAWSFNNNTGSNEFVIGTGTNNGGTQALYVSDDGSTYQYTVSSLSVSYAEVLLEMTAGSYLVQYDWQGYGESSYDYARLFLAPSTTTITTTTYSTYLYSLPSGAISLDNGAKLNLSGSWQSNSLIASVPTDGVYKLIAFWADDSSAGTQPPFAIDNISIQEIQCMPLTSVTQTSLTSTQAKYVATRYTAGLDIQYGYSTVDDVDSITWTTIQGSGLKDTISMTGLTPNTNYYLFVREICDSTHVSAATRVAFQTPASAQTIPFVCGFETSETTTNAWTLVGSNNEFVIGSGASSQGSRALYVSDDGNTWNYTISSTSNSYAYVPLEFSAGTFDIEYDWQAYGESSYDYGRVYLAPSSFIPTAGTMASGIGTTTTPTGWIALDGGSKLNLVSGWQSYSAEHTFTEATTMNLVVFWHNDASVGTQPPFAIDNINITKQLCTSLTFDSISADTIGLNMFTIHYYNPTPGASTQWIVSSNSQYSDTVAMGVCPDSVSSFTATGLSASTTYYCALRSVCGTDTLSKALKFNVRTTCAVMSQFPYDEGFETMTAGYYNLLTQACWATTTMTSTQYAVAQTTSTCVHTGSQGLYVYNSYSSTTPQILALPEMDSLNGKTISFWHKAYSTTSTYNTLSFGYINASGSFVSLNDFTNKVTDWQQYQWNITGLPANVTRLAFKFDGSYYYYLDDIHINKIVQGYSYRDTICHGAAYSGHGFTFNAGQLQDGDTTFTSTIPAVGAGVADSITTLNIYVRPEITNDIYDTICSGQPYNRGLFNITNPTTRTYFRTFTSTTTGCDSTVNLYLYVYPTAETINDTICQGQSYQFGDTTLTATGTYFRTITNTHGCSVTTTLNLLVESTSSTTNATICNGESYQFEGQTYTQSGTYQVTTTTTHGCTVVKTLNLTVIKSDSTFTVSLCAGGQGIIVVDTVIKTAGNYNIRRFHATDPADPTVGCYITYHVTATVDPIIEGNVSDYACQDNPYYGNGVNGVIITQDTTIDVTTKNAEMCDSVTHVHLTFQPTTYSVEDTTIAAGETYTWHYQSLNTTGVYVDTISSYLGCDSVCTLNLTVGSGPDPSGVDNVSDVNINIVPNPVNAGATAFVYGNFGEVKTVEILNNFGQVIDQFEPKSYPIEVSGIAAAGLYYVRVTTVDGQVHLQKLVVK